MINRIQDFKAGLVAVVGSVALGAVAIAPPAAAGPVLINAEEAQLPTPPGSAPAATRGITRGPKVMLVSPAPGSTVKSPVNLSLKFESFNGAQVNASTLKMTYVKSPAVDLTDRVKPYVQASGIEVPQAELATGDHVIKVDVTDSEGRTATTSFLLKVTK